MPLEGIFIEPSSNPVPDLSLHISPPNSSPSSICNSTNNIEVDTSFDLLTRHKSITELSLAHPEGALDHRGPCRRNLTGGAEEPHLRNPYQSHYIHHHHPPPPPPPTQLNHINRGVSLLDVSEGLRPIRGIPVYQNRTFPFLPLDHTRERDGDRDNPQMSFHRRPYSPWPSSSSSPSQSSLYFRPSLDPMSVLNTGRITGGPTRFNGISPSYQLHHHHHHNNQYGVGPSHEASHAMMRSRFIPKLPTKRSMRAPRMRWTSSLHARFVHAVELLGGHESIDLSLF